MRIPLPNELTKDSEVAESLRYVVIDDLSQSEMTIISHQIPYLSLDIGVIQSCPCKISSVELCVWSLLGLNSYRSKGRWAIYRFCCACDIRHPDESLDVNMNGSDADILLL